MMSKKYLAALAVATSALFAANANAGYVLIDDFSQGDQELVIDGFRGPDTASDTNSIRSLSMNFTSTTPPSAMGTASVFGGRLSVSNSPGDIGLVKLGWDLGANTLADGLSGLQFLFTILNSDGNPTKARLFLDGQLISEDDIPGNTANMSFGIDIDTSKWDPTKPHRLELELTGAAGWDLELDALGFGFADIPNKVPEPGSMALLSIGLLGMGAINRRRQRK